MAELLRGPVRAARGGRRRAARAGSSRRSTTSTTASSRSRCGPCASEADRDALLTEARILLGLPPHPHLPLVREDFFDGDDYVIAMDWVEGTDLGRILHTDGRPGLPPSLVLRWLADAAAALTHLHTQDPPVVHGDMKPANLILTKGGRVSLVDFGAVVDRRTRPGRRGGTPGLRGARARRREGESTRAARHLLAGRHRVRAAHRRAADRHPPGVGGHRPRAGRPARGGHPRRAGHRPGPPAGHAGRAGRAAAGRLGQLAADRRAHVLPHRHRGLDRPVGGAAGGDGARARAARQDHRRRGRAPRRALPRSRWARATRPCRCSTRPRAAVVAAIDLTRDLAAVTWPPEADAPGPGRAAHRRGRAARRHDYFGPTLNIAARLRGLADGGQVFLSKDTAALVRDHLPRRRVARRPRPAPAPGRAASASRCSRSPRPASTRPRPAPSARTPACSRSAADDADRFFGRDAVVDDLVARLARPPFVAVVGASGSGKSSLLRAGVGRAGRRRRRHHARHRRPPSTASTASRRPPARRRPVRGAVHPGRRRRGPRQPFLDALLRHRHRPVAIGLRADFYGPCAALPRAWPPRSPATRCCSGPMAPDELRRAIAEPARRRRPAARARAGRGARQRGRGRAGRAAAAVPRPAGDVGGARRPHAHARRLPRHRRGDGRHRRHRRPACWRRSTTTDRDARPAVCCCAWSSRARAPTTPAAGRRSPSCDRPATRGDRVDRVLDALGRGAAGDDRRGHGGGRARGAHPRVARSCGLAGRRARRPAAPAPADRGGRGVDGRRPRAERALPRPAPGRGPRVARPPTRTLSEARGGRSSRERGRGGARRSRPRPATNRRLRRSLVGVGDRPRARAGRRRASPSSRAGRPPTPRDHADVARLAAVSRSLVERQPDVGLLLAAEAYRREDSADTRSTLLAAVEAHPLLEGLLYGTESGLEAAVFTPDGRTLATPTSDGRARSCGTRPPAGASRPCATARTSCSTPPSAPTAHARRRRRVARPERRSGQPPAGVGPSRSGGWRTTSRAPPAC